MIIIWYNIAKRKAVLFALSIGVAIAVALSVVRILIPGVQLWHYLLPGYIIAVVMSFISPKLFVGIAFDSGGVASGPMTATFILAFTQGISEAIEGSNVLVDGFGVIAMVALTPLIALQILGFIFKYKSRKGGDVKHDEQSIQQSSEQLPEQTEQQSESGNESTDSSGSTDQYEPQEF